MPRLKTKSENEGVLSPVQTIGENGETASKAKPKTENGEAVSRAKPKTENGRTASRAKSKRENGATASKVKPKGENQGAESRSEIKRDNEHGRVASLYTYIVAGCCCMTLAVLSSFAILTYLRFLDDYLFAYVIGPLQSLGLIVVAIAVYSVFKSLDFGRVLPWIWALGCLGMVADLNVFWPRFYTDLAIPSKLLGVISFVFALFILKYFFKKRGRISPRKMNWRITILVVLFAVVGSIIPIAAEVSFLLGDQLYPNLVKHLPRFGLVMLWPVEYLGISGEIGIREITGYGSVWNNENVVDIATSSLKVMSNMVAYAAIAFVLGWIMFRRRGSPST